MARSKIEPGTMIDRFRYTPGDHRRYRWQAGRNVITVERINVEKGTGRLTFTPTGDTILAPATATATAMAAAVDDWRSGRLPW